MLGGKSSFDGTEEFSQVSVPVMMSGLVELIISSRSDFLLQTDWKFMFRTLMGLLTLFEMSLVSLRSCLDDSGNFGEEAAAGTPGLY